MKSHRRKAIKAERLAIWAEDQKRLAKADFSFKVLDKTTHHIRVTSATGVVCDYWPTTFSWLSTAKGQIRSQGKGLNRMMAFMKKAEPVPVHKPTPKPDATIFADASVCVKTRAAGWGAWMVAEDMRPYECGAALREIPFSASVAEVQALACALQEGLSRGYVRTGGVVMLQSDNLGALGRIAAHTPGCLISDKGGAPVSIPRRTGAARLNVGAKFIADLARTHELTIIVRHVRGHQEGPGRQWVNNRCDEIAKGFMRQRRRQLQTAAGAA